MKQSDDKRRLIIGAPLMLIVVFSFGFFLMHPRNEPSRTAVSDTSVSKKTPAANTSASASQLQNLPQAEPAQTASSSSAVAGDSTTSSASNDSSPTASSSQPASKSSATNTKTETTSRAKSGTGKSTSTTSNQGGLIQTVVNSLLNGR